MTTMAEKLAAGAGAGAGGKAAGAGAEGAEAGAEGGAKRERRPKREQKPRGERKPRERKEVEAPAERPDRLPQPDRKELDAQCAALSAKREECKARMAEIKALIDSKQSGRGAVMSATKEARNALVEIRAELKALYVR